SQKYFVIFWQDGFTKFSVIILITVFASRIMYETIEIPSQKLARKLISKIR
ncbi:acyltransferase, partial [Salmonella enterica]|nr:acyltransferase [Salmonella enterica]